MSSVLKFTESALVVGSVPPDQLACVIQLPEAKPEDIFAGSVVSSSKFHGNFYFYWVNF